MYNSRIVKIGIEYLSAFHPTIDAEKLLSAVNFSRQEVENPAHWFNQLQVDAFHQIVTEITGDGDFSRNVGRYYAETKSLGPMRQFTIGLMGRKAAYSALAYLYPMINKGAVLHCRTLAPNRVEVTSMPEDGVDEKPYQCANRIGVLEAMGKFFSEDFSTVQHTECRHDKGRDCRYIVSWSAPSHERWKRISSLSIPAGMIATVVSLPFLPLSHWPAFLLSVGGTIAALFFRTEWLTRKHLEDIAARQQSTAVAEMDAANMRYGMSVLFRELGHVISSVRETDGIIDEISKVMEKRLSFARGVFLIADESRSYLEHRGSYGFSPNEKRALFGGPISIDPEMGNNVLAAVFNEKKQMLLTGASQLQEHMPIIGKWLVETLNLHSIVAVPIVYENTSLGVIMVDNTSKTQPISQIDISFLSGIAAQTAVGIVNARSFQQLRESEAKYRILADNITDVIWSVELATLRFVYLSPAVERLLGYKPEELVTKTVDRILMEESMAETVAILEEELVREKSVMADPDRHRTLQVAQKRKDGATIWVEFTARFLRNTAGKPTHAIGVSRDITERRQANEERKLLQDRLQRAEKMEALGALAGGVAHDLNNILAGVTGYPELLLMDIPKDSPMRKPIETIYQSGQKAAAIVQDLLTLARRGVTVTGVVNLNKVIADYLESPEYRELAAAHPAVTIRAQLAAELLSISGSPLHLAKTVMNLVSNAAESIEGNGEVILTTANRHMDTSRIGYEKITSGDYAVLMVEDNGSGISEKDIDFIFEPFFTKKKMGRSGTGLGMAVVWGTVKDHNGYIDVKSIEGQGTVVTLYFPVTRDNALLDGQAEQCDTLEGNGEVILVVDDVDEQRDIASAMLTRLGYTVITTDSGDNALKILKRPDAAVDLVVLDMIMPPGIDGFETYRRILEIRPNQKAVIASGFSETERVRAAQKLGAGAYVKKPYTLGKIGRAVFNELQRSR